MNRRALLLSVCVLACCHSAPATAQAPGRFSTVTVTSTASDALKVGAASVADTDLAKIDGITNGTAAAGKALVADSNVDITAGLRNAFASGKFYAPTFGHASAFTMDVNGTTVGTWGIPSGSGPSSNFLNVTGTLPTSTGNTNGLLFAITSAGAGTFAQRALQIQMLAGYTGSGSTVAFAASNAALGTGADAFFGTANRGFDITVLGSGSGDKVAGLFVASNSSNKNVGVVGRATASSNSPQVNVGTSGFGLNGSSGSVGGFFGLMSAAPTIAETAALMADNGAESANIASFRDNGTTVAAVKDGGTIDGVAYQVGGVAGASATCAAGVASMTVTNGIITAITCS